ncbi:MAG: MFS transporter [Oscillospiraceae bacterium]|nr:MFS transporter [Oscillospiraceae bacterium]
MKWHVNSPNIVESVRILKGNARTSVLFEPMWSVPYVFYSFYLSLYMKSQGVTDVQIGFLISLGYVFGIFSALIGGAVVDKMGRRRCSLVFSLISWAGSVLIYLFSNSFWMFLLAQIVNSLSKISDVAWNLLLIEGSDDDQRLAAFNLFGIIDIVAGLFTPLAGMVVANFGVAVSERGFLLFAFVMMAAQALWRNHYYRESELGAKMAEQSRNVSFFKTFCASVGQMKGALTEKNPKMRTVLAVFVLFQVYMTIGAFSSLYFAPYLTDVLGLDKAMISVLGTVNACFTLGVYVFVIPLLSRFNRILSSAGGLLLLAVSMAAMILIPSGSFLWAAAAVALYSVGYGVTRPMLDALLASVTSEQGRAGVYALKNTMIALASALTGALSGYLYGADPRGIYIASSAILLLCLALIGWYFRQGRRAAASVS